MRLKIANSYFSGQDIRSRWSMALRLWHYYIFCFSQRFRKQAVILSTFLLEHTLLFWQKAQTIGSKTEKTQSMKKEMEKVNA